MTQRKARPSATVVGLSQHTETNMKRKPTWWDTVDLPDGWQQPNKRYFMVLADGETYTELSGCTIVAVTKEWADRSDADELERLLENAVLNFGSGGGPAVAEHVF